MASPLKVLIVEDVQSDAELMVHELKQAGFLLDWKRVDTEDLYLAALESNPDLILSDYSLPQFDAFLALRLLQERKLDIPFIVISGAITEELAVEFMKQGASDYLIKDRLARLGQAVVRALEQKELRKEKRSAEEELRRSEEKYRLLIENSHDIIYTIGSDGIFTFVSPSWPLHLGHTSADIIGKSFRQFIHQDDADKYQAFLQKVFEAGERQSGIEYRMLHADGTWRWHMSNVAPAKNESGNVVSIVGIAIDITERRRAEETLRTSLAEKEVLLKEIHHRVKNNLASISTIISLQQDKFTDPAVVAEFNELIGRVQSMALVHTLLYQTKTLSRIDMQDYLETLVARLHHSYCSHAVISSSVAAAGVTMNLDSAIPCGLMVNELVTNAFKFAFPEGRPRPGEQDCEIAVTAAWDGSAYTLTVQDNGVGLPADLDWRATQSLGLQLVAMLGQHQLNGQIELDRSDGTTFRLRFAPKNHNRS